MARPFKIFLATLTALLVLIIIAAVTVPILFDPNDYREQIYAAVKDATGRDLQIGDIELSVFPWLRVRLRAVALSNAEGFGEEPFAEAREIAVGVKPLPLLLDRRVEASTVTLDGVHARLAVNEAGKTNWDDLLAQAEQEAQQPEPASQPASEREFQLAAVAIEGVSIKHSSLRYADAQAGRTVQLEDLNLQTGEIIPGEPFDLEASTNLLTTSPELTARVSLAARINPDLEAQTVHVEDLALDAAAQGEQLEAQLALQGELLADGANAVYTLRDLVAKITAKGEAVPGASQEVELRAVLRFDARAGTLTLAPATLDAGGVHAALELQGQDLNSDHPRLHGPVRVETFSPRDVMPRFGLPAPETADPQALTSLSLNAQYSGGLDSAALSDIALRLDQSAVTGRLQVEHFAAPAIRFALAVDQLDADRYLPPPDAKAVEAPKDATDLDAIEFPFEMLEALDLEGTLDIGALVLQGLQLKDVQIRLEGAKGTDKQASIGARLYRGELAADARISPGNPGRLALDAALTSIAIGPLLRDYTGEDKMRGTGTIRLNGQTQGATIGTMRRELDGRLSLDFRDGAIKGFNLGQILRRAQATLRGAPFDDSEPQETDFAELHFSADITDGVLSSRDLDAKSPLFRVTGEGTIDLVHETLDYLAKPTVAATSKGQGGKGLEDLAGLTIPVRATGSFSDPKIRVDIQEALKQKATEKLREEIGGEQELRQKLNEELGNALDKLFGDRPPKQPKSEPPT